MTEQRVHTVSVPKSRYEYRVVWQRRGMDRKSKRYAALKSAKKRVLLMGPEPWLALGVNPDEYHCHKGQSAYNECGCDGLTWREHLLNARKGSMHQDDDGMPPIEFIRIERRPVSDWEPLSDEQNRAAARSWVDAHKCQSFDQGKCLECGATQK